MPCVGHGMEKLHLFGGWVGCSGIHLRVIPRVRPEAYMLKLAGQNGRRGVQAEASGTENAMARGQPGEWCRHSKGCSAKLLLSAFCLLPALQQLFHSFHQPRSPPGSEVRCLPASCSSHSLVWSLVAAWVSPCRWGTRRGVAAEGARQAGASGGWVENGRVHQVARQSPPGDRRWHPEQGQVWR